MIESNANIVEGNSDQINMKDMRQFVKGEWKIKGSQEWKDDISKSK